MHRSSRSGAHLVLAFGFTVYREAIAWYDVGAGGILGIEETRRPVIIDALLNISKGSGAPRAYLPRSRSVYWSLAWDAFYREAISVVLLRNWMHSRAPRGTPAADPVIGPWLVIPPCREALRYDVI